MKQACFFALGLVAFGALVCFSIAGAVKVGGLKWGEVAMDDTGESWLRVGIFYGWFLCFITSEPQTDDIRPEHTFNTPLHV